MAQAKDRDLRREATTVESLGPLYGESKRFKDSFNSQGIGIKTAEDEAALKELRNTNFDYFYENTVEGAPEDCGDERPAGEGKLVKAMTRLLGPQNMGGTSTNALVYGLVTNRTESHPRMIAILNTEYTAAGVEYRPGGHTAGGAHHPNCGCAAIDHISSVVDVCADSKKHDALAYLVAGLSGQANVDEVAFATNVRKYTGLKERLDDYLPAGYQHKSLELMRQLSPGIDAVNERTGKHQGLAVIANFIPRTRLSQDTLALSRRGRPLEAFGVDSWYAYDLADRLFPYKTPAQREFITGRLMFDAATALAITDGSLDFMVHRPL